MKAPPFFYKQTQGMRITVRPVYAAEHSRPSQRQYVFVYHIRIENIGDKAAQLLSRYWLIRDSIGEDTEVEGEGVLGEQPVIRPGHVHEYQSFCVLKSPNGTMEGRYHFRREDGTEFDADIPKFVLEAGGTAWA
jgi:ApaG protein